ncbi:MAG: hypothetical protein A2161_04415 [Candidatus Schekmanbacteria bacterium RBG_13_48_7]|uniref:Uncharacterized protein n=1 Tax=Candidatus Schekmanbacteria bacterium RBG_13_48_7 TaxID=1817878 RepID=A0A1F7S4A5_9BACT|nr:MAG: hypothetical protein A2161_04415 [Candidatus Schekmanbacteria bacterium RBG_13_48_7]
MNAQFISMKVQNKESCSPAKKHAYMTLCDLIDMVSSMTEDDDHLTAKIVAHMVNTGLVKLIGSFNGRKLAFI